jgi:hypothetical protein
VEPVEQTAVAEEIDIVVRDYHWQVEQTDTDYWEQQSAVEEEAAFPAETQASASLEFGARAVAAIESAADSASGSPVEGAEAQVSNLAVGSLPFASAHLEYSASAFPVPEQTAVDTLDIDSAASASASSSIPVLLSSLNVHRVYVPPLHRHHRG